MGFLEMIHSPTKNTYITWLCEILLSLLISGQMVINFEDINDNVPEFIDSDSVFGEFILEIVLEDEVGCRPTCQQKDTIVLHLLMCQNWPLLTALHSSAKLA